MNTRCRCKYNCNLDALDYRLYLIYEETQRLLYKVSDLVIDVTSAIRCHMHNVDVGGDNKSYHLDGLAMDIVAEGISEEQLKFFVELAVDNLGLEFIDIVAHKGHVHIEYDYRRASIV